MKIHNAKRTDSEAIARLIMTAMTDDCCLYYAGEGHTLGEFQSMMQELVENEHSQYCYLNTLVATDESGEVIGASVSYDGARLHELREAFITAARRFFGRDFSGMDDETGAGELYLDSLAVLPQHRGRGIATALIEATAEKARREGHSVLGLLVDKGNPKAERLYLHAGFTYQNDALWGGHPMKHLTLDTRNKENKD